MWLKNMFTENKHAPIHNVCNKSGASKQVVQEWSAIDVEVTIMLLSASS